jgi:hypothetical protein
MLQYKAFAYFKFYGAYNYLTGSFCRIFSLRVQNFSPALHFVTYQTGADSSSVVAIPQSQSQSAHRRPLIIIMANNNAGGRQGANGANGGQMNEHVEFTVKVRKSTIEAVWQSHAV